jgi:hypothetical protein
MGSRVEWLCLRRKWIARPKHRFDLAIINLLETRA